MKAEEREAVEVVLVNEQDEVLGTMEKMEAHRRALLHRAVSVFLVNGKGEWLLQRRNACKYHSGGLWTNACCTHPLPGESYEQAARRRLKEEIGIECGPLQYIFRFIYRAELDHELTEHELDYIFITTSDALPNVNPEEVDDWEYVSFPALSDSIAAAPEAYTVWFRHIYKTVETHLINNTPDDDKD